MDRTELIKAARKALFGSSAALAAVVAQAALYFAIAQSAPNPEDAPIKVETLLINIPVVVSDRDGRHVGGLTRDDFSIMLNGERQAIEYFADSEAAVSVAIVLDLSGSTIPYISRIREAAKAFVEKLNPTDQGLVLTFDQFGKMELVSKLTSDRKKLSGTIGSIQHDFAYLRGRAGFKRPEIFPDVYDAVHRVITKEFAEVKGRKAIIVLTDGFIVGQTVTPRVFDDSIIEADTVIYPVMLLTRHHVERGTDKVTYDALSKHPVTQALASMADKTGGRILIAAKGVDFKAAFQSVGEELRKQYILGFHPTTTNPGRSARIELAVNRPSATIRSKKTIRIKPPE